MPVQRPGAYPIMSFLALSGTNDYQHATLDVLPPDNPYFDPRGGRLWVVGFEELTDPDDVEDSLSLDAVSLSAPWFVVGRGHASGDPRSQFPMSDPSDTDLTPDQVQELIDASKNVRYIVPVYFHVAHPLHVQTPVPSSVLVTMEDIDGFLGVDPDVKDAIDVLAGGQGFVEVSRRASGDTAVVIHYCSVGLGERMKDEPGSAIWLRDEVNGAFDGLVTRPNAYLDWFVTDVNRSDGWQLPTTLAMTANCVDDPVAVAGGDVDVRIGVLDGQFDLDHPAFAGAISTPWNAITQSSGLPGATGSDSHGTSCVGILIGRPSPPHFAGGMALGATAMPIAIYAPWDPYNARREHLTAAIWEALANGCHVLSISVSGYEDEGASDLRNALAHAEQRGCVVVSGTGNLEISKTPSATPDILYPAAYDTVFAVGAARVVMDGQLRILKRIDGPDTQDFSGPWASRFGPEIDVVSYGRDVATTDISGADGLLPGDYWCDFAGTSAAVPFVAAAAARLRDVAPTVSAGRIRKALRVIADRNFAEPEFVNEWNIEVGHGWIGKKEVANITSLPDEPISEKPQEDHTDARDHTDTRDHACACTEAIPSGADYPYAGAFANCLRPMTDFVNALTRGRQRGVSKEDQDMCCTLLVDFFANPYRTARIAGMPWHAAILLGHGDWGEIQNAVRTEGNTRSSSSGAGPIWVRAK